jgi:ketosteroid isomerase-like protein
MNYKTVLLCVLSSFAGLGYGDGDGDSVANLAENTETSKIGAVLSLIESWKRSDVDGVIELLSDDVVWHTSTGIKPPLRSKVAVREWLEGFVDQVHNSKWRVNSYAESGNMLFVEGIEDFELPSGIRVVIPYSGVYEFTGGKINGVREYFDGRLSKSLKEGGEIPAFIKELTARKAIE